MTTGGSELRADGFFQGQLDRDEATSAPKRLGRDLGVLKDHEQLLGKLELLEHVS